MSTAVGAPRYSRTVRGGLAYRGDLSGSISRVLHHVAVGEDGRSGGEKRYPVSTGRAALVWMAPTEALVAVTTSADIAGVVALAHCRCGRPVHLARPGS